MSWSKSDKIASVALVISLLSAALSGYVSWSARLDAKRQALRADATQLLDAVQVRVGFFHCHFTALGRTVDEDSPELQQVITGLKEARRNLSLIDDWGDAGLDTFREQLDTSPPVFMETADGLIFKVRARLDHTELEKIDRVCKLGF